MKIILALFGLFAVSAGQIQDVNLIAECQNRCDRSLNQCYLSYPGTCRKYIWCVMQINQAYGMLCPKGTFFDSLQGRCLHSHLVDCQFDKCRNQPNLFDYKDEYKSDCKYYWTCREDGRSYPACCQAGYAYVEGQGCKEDPTCFGRCHSEHVCTRPEPTRNCRVFWNCTEDKHFESVCCPPRQGYNSTLQKCVNDITCIAECPKDCPAIPVPGNNKMFIHGGEAKSCPKGTIFDYGACQCIMGDQAENKDCDPTVEIDFMGEQNIGSQAYVRYFPESLINGSGIGYFNGMSHLEVPYFIDGKDLGTLYLNMEFKVDNAGPNRQVLVSNCKTKETNQASFQVLLDRQQEVLLVLGYTYESFRILEIPFEISQWNKLEVEFNGSELKVKVTPEEQDVTKDYEVEGSLEGKLRKAQMPLNFGACLNLKNQLGENVNTFFHGRMRNIEVYTDCIPKAEAPMVMA